MSQNPEVIVNNFVTAFNKMCQSERKDFLIRERTVQYESGSGVKRYNVKYVTRVKGDQIDILAESGWWIFKSKFPLFSVKISKDTATFKGLYTKDFGTFPKSELKTKLDEYLAMCKELPQNAFIRS